MVALCRILGSAVCHRIAPRAGLISSWGRFGFSFQRVKLLLLGVGELNLHRGRQLHNRHADSPQEAGESTDAEVLRTRWLIQH